MGTNEREGEKCKVKDKKNVVSQSAMWCDTQECTHYLCREPRATGESLQVSKRSTIQTKLQQPAFRNWQISKERPLKKQYLIVRTGWSGIRLLTLFFSPKDEFFLATALIYGLNTVPRLCFLATQTFLTFSFHMIKGPGNSVLSPLLPIAEAVLA